MYLKYNKEINTTSKIVGFITALEENSPLYLGCVDYYGIKGGLEFNKYMRMCNDLGYISLFIDGNIQITAEGMKFLKNNKKYVLQRQLIKVVANPNQPNDFKKFLQLNGLLEFKYDYYSWQLATPKLTVTGVELFWKSIIS